jgi:hypothetical protein
LKAARRTAKENQRGTPGYIGRHNVRDDESAMVVHDPASSRSRASTARGFGMDLGNYLQKGLAILQLDKAAIREIAKDEDSLVPALFFFALAGLASGAGQFSVSGMFFGAILATLLSFVLVGLLNVLSRLLGGSASFLELYRPLGIAAPIHWVQAVPVIGPFVGLLALLYFAVVAALVVETSGGLPRPRAAAVVATLTGISLFLCLVFLALLGSLMLFRAIFS